MKTYRATFINDISEEKGLEDLSRQLDSLQKAAIDTAPWPEFSYKPRVSFALGYDERHIYLEYFVEEQTTRALYTEINDPVYKDSCVEFFVSFNNEPAYYNLEFNCLGVCLAAHRTSRANKKRVPTELLQKIETLSVLTRKHGEEKNNYWQLTIAIPIECFCFSHLETLKGQEARANFYKCGDGLPNPHYLCWSPIDTPKPDFHRPEFFGLVQFV